MKHNLNLSATLTPIELKYSIEDLNTALNKVIEYIEIYAIPIEKSEPYGSISAMLDDVINRGFLYISNLFHPPYVPAYINVKMRLIHDYCHCLALYEGLCEDEFTTNSEVAAYYQFERLIWEYIAQRRPKNPALYLNLIQYNRADFLAQTVLYEQTGEFMQVQTLFDTSQVIAKNEKIQISIL
jgi:hypothetical protein